MLDLVLELFFGDFDRGLVDLDVLVAVDGESGNEFEDRLDVERRPSSTVSSVTCGWPTGECPARGPPC